MTDYGITQDGFNKKPREKIVEDLISKVENIFDIEINTTDKNPLIKILKVVSYPIALYWYGLESVYNNAYINFAEGQSLDYLGKMIGLTRSDTTKAEGNETFNGDEGTTIPEGFKVVTDSDPAIEFETTENGTIQSNGEVVLGIIAIEAGEEGNVAPNTITEITNPISGLDSVTNEFETQGGSDVESDYNFRERYKDSITLPGAATIDSIRASVRNVDAVRNAIIKENYTMDTDADGLPPKSIEAIVVEGIDEDIAEVILDTKAAGIKSHGDITITVEDDAGNEHDISFSRPSTQMVYVDVNLTTNASFPDNGVIEVESEIIQYIGGTDANDDEYAGLGAGENVVYTKLIDVAYNVKGVEDVNITVGTDDNPSGTSNISIDDYEIVETNVSNVDVVD